MNDLRNVSRAITLHRWWAFAVAFLGKDEENRRYRPPSVVSPDGEQEWIAMIRLRNNEPPTSEIVAITRIESIRPAGEEGGPWSRASEFGWRLGTVYRLDVPIACAGRQRVWRLDEEQREAVRRARLVECQLAALRGVPHG